MKRLFIAIAGLALLFPVTNRSVTRSLKPADIGSGITIEASEPSGSIYQPGERINFRFKPSGDSYVIVFDIDTEGYVHLLYPEDGKIGEKSKGSIEYVIPSQLSSFMISGSTGMEFVFALAVKERRDINEEELSFLAENERLPIEKRFHIDGDPMLAANMIVGEIVRGIGHNNEASLAFTSFYINEKVEHPRYICAQCHGNLSNPYMEPCSEYEFSMNSENSSNLSYPLERGFEITQLAAIENEESKENNEDAEASEEEDQGDSSTKIYVSFYPYDSYIHVPSYFTSYYYDPWFSSPLWYDPWLYGDPFFYSGGFGFYSSWGWGWGWPYGAWDSYWYPWDYYDYSYGYSSRRHLRPLRYKHRSSLYDATAYNSRRNPDLRISSIKYKKRRDERSSDLNLAKWRYKKERTISSGENQIHRKIRSDRKRPIHVKHNKSHVRNTRVSKYALKHRTKTVAKSRHTYKAQRQWEKPYPRSRNYKGKTFQGQKGKSRSIISPKGKTQIKKNSYKERRSFGKARSSRIRSRGSQGSRSHGSRGSWQRSRAPRQSSHARRAHKK